MRKTHSREFCALVNAADRRGWANGFAPNPQCAIRNPQSRVRRITPHLGEYCPAPGAKFTEFRPTAAHQLAASKRLAASARGEIGRISPHVKKEKNLVRRKPRQETPTAGAVGSWPVSFWRQMRRKHWGILTNESWPKCNPRLASAMPVVRRYAGCVPFGISRRRTTSQARPTFSISQIM